MYQPARVYWPTSVVVGALLIAACSGGGGGGAGPEPPNNTPAPTVSLTADPIMVVPGQTTVLTWSSTDATNCTASGDWSGTRATSGSESSAAIVSMSNFVLRCTGPGGAAQENAAVEVLLPEPPNSMRAAGGDTRITVSWSGPTGNYFGGYLVVTNVYLSTTPNIDVEAFVATPPNRVIRGLTALAPIIIKRLENDVPVYLVAANEVNGVQTVPTEEVSVTPQPVPPLTENIVALNDTGVTGCADDMYVNQPCPQPSRPNQDGDQGRDADARDGLLTKTGFGPGGFDFTKLDANGDVLPDDAALWQCIRDNVTGLIWQVHDDSGLTSAENRYSWYEPDPLLNGGDAGRANGGSCTGTECDTHAFVQALNAAALCGFQDWRLPTRRELFSLVDYSRIDPALPTSVFRSVPTYFNPFYWSSNTYPTTVSVGISAWALDISTGTVLDKRKSGTFVGPGSILAVRADANP